jgi:hypothetical protein
MSMRRLMKVASGGRQMFMTMRLPGSFKLLTLAMSATIVALLAARTAADRSRCVGMFLDPNPGGPGSRLPANIPATGNNLTIRGKVPCMDSVFAWSPRGPYRVFEDGTVEFLASPMPPCPGGDFYVWIAFPN